MPTIDELVEKFEWHKKQLAKLKRRTRRNVQWQHIINPDYDEMLQHQLKMNELEREIIRTRAPQPSFL